MEEKLSSFIQKLNKDERSILKNAISHQIETFFDANNNLMLKDDHDRKRFSLVATTLKSLSNTKREIPDNGIIYFGRPNWVTHDLIRKLIIEAEERRLEPLDKIDHFLGCGGRLADELADSEELVKFIQGVAGEIKKTGIASYIYYDQPGLGIKPHVDTDVFAINLILMLKHEVPEDIVPSATVIFPATKPPEFYRLKVGEVLIMYGGNVIHTRTIIQKNENVHILTIGFNPIE